LKEKVATILRACGPISLMGHPFRRPLPVYPYQRTFSVAAGMSQMCPPADVQRDSPPPFFTSDRGRLSVDRLVRQMVLMPNGIENAESAGESDSEYPGKVPHSASSIETG
jgi:hypothetical protein